MVVSDLLFDLDETRKTLIHTRTNIHSFNIDYVDSNAVAGFKAAQAAMMGANASLNEFGFRQKGLFLFSFIITFLVLVLGIKIKGLKENN
jgi:phosphoenolpyruvate carboxylase